MSYPTKFHHLSVKAVLYYVRLKTHSGSNLFDSQHNYLESAVVEETSTAHLQIEKFAAENPEKGLEENLETEHKKLPPKSLSSVLSKIVSDELLLAASCRGITLDQWMIVPDALHALIFVQEDRPDSDITSGKPRLLNAFVAGFKAATAKRINLIRNQPGSPVWQRSYQEQRVEDEFMLARLRKKINTADNTADNIVESSQPTGR